MTNGVVCNSCPRSCFVPEGKTGKCLARMNVGGRMEETEPLVSTIITGPIEQKLFHFMPGARCLSAGFCGCPLNCKFCQNFEISQIKSLGEAPKDGRLLKDMDIGSLIGKSDAACFALTYSEPSVYAKHARVLFETARGMGKATVLKTNACLDSGEFGELLGSVSAVNIDVKGTPEIYREVCGVPGTALDLVLENVGIARGKCHLEVSVPALVPRTGLRWNPSYSWLFGRIQEKAGKRTPIRLLRIFPEHELRDEETLGEEGVAELAGVAKRFFEHVYVDDGKGENVTECPSCHAELVRRIGSRTLFAGVDEIGVLGECLRCGYGCGIVLSPSQAVPFPNAPTVPVSAPNPDTLSGEGDPKEVPAHDALWKTRAMFKLMGRGRGQGSDQEDVLDWDSATEVPPPKRQGKIKARLKFMGRGKPIPCEDPSAEGG